MLLLKTGVARDAKLRMIVTKEYEDIFATHCPEL